MVQQLLVPPLADLTDAVARLAIADLWATTGPLAGLGPALALEVLLDVLPGTVEKWALAAGSVAADWYEWDREAHGVRGHFTAVVPPLGDTGAEELARWAAVPLQQDTPDWALAQSRTEGGLQRRVANGSRDTIIDSSLADRHARGWQRITSGGGCGFCTMLASRGAVYSRKGVEFGAHDWCRCSCAPAWDARPKPVKAYVPSERQATPAERAATREWIKQNIGAPQ